ncbi:hypothetical protein CHRY9390_01100 [Chryseobacterium aquaeductus]|uniref:Uncharacterized protein n=1 Tax=Chryseobacterium aquaeductus TaxID=2675056 RepID=A0A9N8QRL9_9FLAO|nr:hypothetical protein [Chryseobacterium aquaeductus]CAA7330432.1 hypothetical protein CHRY9390_01100 [Chryseobacterium potabilaquae]CAD7803595.1 hypothetical protein CHRY9390_01100 [Chryseobacterium aquaeductus]
MISENKVISKSFLISVSIFFVLCFGYYINVLYKTDFHYTYVLDDAYIHLAMAKNFALHNVWGVTSHEFSSSSSSPLFTYLLSLTIEFLGNNDQFPLYLNIVFGVGVFYFLNRYYSEFFQNVRNVVFAILFTVFFAVLHLQMMSGMEHLLHVLLIVINVYCLLKIKRSRLAVYGFYVTIVLMGLVRFENMFYFVSLAICFILIKKWKTALMVILVGFVPVMIFCWFNFQESGYFFPNSLIVKGTRLDFDSNLMIQIKDIVLNNLLLNISFYKVGIFPLAMCTILIYRDFKNQKPTEVVKNNFLLIAFSMLMICHALFADLKSGFRYEAYILVGFSMALIPKLKSVFENFRGYIKHQKLMSFLVLANFALLIYKFWIAHLVLDNGGKNIYEQQVQSAKFLNTYYNKSKVVANDIGAITYYTDIQLFDIVGLGSAEMIPFTKDKKRFDSSFEDFVGNFIADHHYELAVVYEDWFDGHVPKTWEKVAVLKISNKITVYGEEVSIYCIDLNNCNQLKNNVKNFKWNKNVKVQIID